MLNQLNEELKENVQRVEQLYNRVSQHGSNNQLLDEVRELKQMLIKQQSVKLSVKSDLQEARNSLTDFARKRQEFQRHLESVNFDQHAPVGMPAVAKTELGIEYREHVRNLTAAAAAQKLVPKVPIGRRQSLLPRPAKSLGKPPVEERGRQPVKQRERSTSPLRTMPKGYTVRVADQPVFLNREIMRPLSTQVPVEPREVSPDRASLKQPAVEEEPLPVNIKVTTKQTEVQTSPSHPVIVPKEDKPVSADSTGDSSVSNLKEWMQNEIMMRMLRRKNEQQTVPTAESVKQQRARLTYQQADDLAHAVVNEMVNECVNKDLRLAAINAINEHKAKPAVVHDDVVEVKVKVESQPHEKSKTDSSHSATLSTQLSDGEVWSAVYSEEGQVVHQMAVADIQRTVDEAVRGKKKLFAVPPVNVQQANDDQGSSGEADVSKIQLPPTAKVDHLQPSFEKSGKTDHPSFENNAGVSSPGTSLRDIVSPVTSPIPTRHDDQVKFDTSVETTMAMVGRSIATASATATSFVHASATPTKNDARTLLQQLGELSMKSGSAPEDAISEVDTDIDDEQLMHADFGSE